MEGNYLQLVEFISQSSSVSIEDIERKIEAKQAKLAGLISKEGAAQIIAAELNVNFDKQMIKIVQMVPGMRRINLIGKIIELAPIREYNKNGRSGKIGSFVLADDTSNVRTVLWDENHIDLIGKGSIKMDVVVEIGNASIRNGELHLGSFSEIKISKKKIDNVVTEKPVFVKNHLKLMPNHDFINFELVRPRCIKKSSKTIEKIEKIKNPFFSILEITIICSSQNIGSVARTV